MTEPESIVQDAADPLCGICWADESEPDSPFPLRIPHFCDMPIGHEGDHQCSCREKLKRPLKTMWKAKMSSGTARWQDDGL
jgi:hypothetical protein